MSSMAGPSAFKTLIFRVELHIEEWLVEGSAIIFYFRGCWASVAEYIVRRTGNVWNRSCCGAVARASTPWTRCGALQDLFFTLAVWSLLITRDMWDTHVFFQIAVDQKWPTDEFEILSICQRSDLHDKPQGRYAIFSLIASSRRWFTSPRAGRMVELSTIRGEFRKCGAVQECANLVKSEIL